jgi:hypothetical protein
MKKTRKAIVPLAETALKRHFGKRPLQELITVSRTFPVTARVDVQLALDKMFAKHPEAKLVGVHTQYQHETLTVAHLLGNQHFPVKRGLSFVRHRIKVSVTMVGWSSRTIVAVGTCSACHLRMTSSASR